MADELKHLEVRIDLLSEEVASLRNKVELLAALVERPTPVLPSAPVAAAQAAPETVAAPPKSPVQPPEIPSLPSFEGMSSRILSQASTASFLMVIALILRTITDYGLINKQLGAYIGIGYAAILIGIGWHRYAKASPQAPIFTACGAILMYLVIGETNLNPKFHLLPLLPAHILLIITGIATAAITNRFRAGLPFSIGTVGMALSAIALTFHETSPDFRFLIVTLLAANVLGHFTVRLEKCIWVRWTLMILTVSAAVWWAYRIVIPVLTEPSTVAAARTQLPWFLAGVGLFGFTYLIIAAWEIIAGKSERVNFYYLALPTITVLWSFGSAQYLTTVLASGNYLVNLLGLAVSAFHIGVVWVLAHKRTEGRGGLGAICNAGALILALSLPKVVGSALFALPVLSAAAFILVYFSGIWQSGGARLTSYFLQVHTVAYLMYLMSFEKITVPLLAVGASAGISVLAYVHYHWARINLPPRDVRFFARIDQKDLSAVVMLIMSLASGFFALQGVSLLLLGSDNPAALIAAQSVIINGTAAGLVIWGYLGRDTEKRNISILVILLGALKVLFQDLAGTTGVPLVLSVLSFGIATAILSIFMSRWQKRMTGGDATS